MTPLEYKKTAAKLGGATKALKASGVSGRLPDPTKLKADYKRLTAEKDALSLLP